MLIGVELLENIKAYLIEKVVYVEIVMKVALIAIARKVIILDLEKYSSLTLLGLAALIFAVALAFFFINGAGKQFQIRSMPLEFAPVCPIVPRALRFACLLVKHPWPSYVAMIKDAISG